MANICLTLKLPDIITGEQIELSEMSPLKEKQSSFLPSLRERYLGDLLNIFTGLKYSRRFVSKMLALKILLE